MLETEEDYRRYKIAEFYRATRYVMEPMIKEKIEFISLVMPKITIFPCGRIEKSFIQEDQEIIDKIDARMKEAMEYLVAAFKKDNPDFKML